MRLTGAEPVPAFGVILRSTEVWGDGQMDMSHAALGLQREEDERYPKVNNCTRLSSPAFPFISAHTSFLSCFPQLVISPSPTPQPLSRLTCDNRESNTVRAHYMATNGTRFLISPHVPASFGLTISLHLHIAPLTFLGRLMRSSSPPRHITFRMSEPIFMKLGMCHGILANLNGVLHKSLPSVCVCIPPIIARQRLG
jgi:hypothetical protein